MNSLESDLRIINPVVAWLVPTTKGQRKTLESRIEFPQR